MNPHKVNEKLATLQAWQQRFAAATRALANEPQLTVKFGIAATFTPARTVTLPALSDPADSEERQLIRGSGDQAALRRRYHNYALHQRLRPADALSALAFDWLENVRIEWLGAAHMQGVRANLAHKLELDALHQGYFRRRTESLPAIAANLAMAVRESVLTGDAPAAMIPMIREWQNELNIKAPKLLRALPQQAHDQQGFAKLVLEMIEKLDLKVAHQSSLLPEENREGNNDQNELPQEQTGETEELTPLMQSSGESAPIGQAGLLPAGLGEREMPPASMENALAPPRTLPSHSIPNTPPPYHSYVNTEDEIIRASQLATPQEMEHLSVQLEQKLVQFQALTTRLAGRLQRFLMARQAREWSFDEEEGVIDSRRLARLIVRPDMVHIFKREKQTSFRDTVVTLLIDNSGSMRGRPITIAALSASILARTLERCGVKVEVLGFTTREWKGGNAYKQWLKAGRPPHPGRLNDLRHIIYKSADTPWRKTRKNLALMLKDGLLKENIDGEAILWACERLLARPEERRILMVISDGAPVDDSTLSTNSGNYLDQHLREVIARVENSLPIELLAIGIGHDVTRYYSHAVTISDIEKLGETMTKELIQLFAERKTGSKRRN